MRPLMSYHPPPLRLLYEAHRILSHEQHLSEMDAYKSLLEILGGLLKFCPLKREISAVKEKLIPLLRQSVSIALSEGKAHDYLGDLLDLCEGGKHEGQFLTPHTVVEMMTEMTIMSSQDGPLYVLDPCCGTGRFGLAALKKDARVLMYSVDIDPWMCRATLINFLLYFPQRRWFVLCADSLVMDLNPSSPNWRFANRWMPVDRKELILTARPDENFPLMKNLVGKAYP